LTLQTINQHIIKAEYAVRGKVVIEALELEKQLRKGARKPFDEIIYCNIGNPQQLRQTPLTFHRNVLSLTSSPTLLNHSLVDRIFLPDEISRAKFIIENADGKSTGSYTHSKGMEFIRKDICEFIQKRDSLPTDPERIFLTDGASPGVQMALKLLINNSNDGIMLPIPQYPLYSASIELFGGKQVNYYLTEESNDWKLSSNDLQKSLAEAKKNGINVKGLVVINPGNPTGQVFTKENMKDIIQFCLDNKIVLLADEVYQENIYGQLPFYSFKKIVAEMGLSSQLEMFSFHSVSKGFLGECGRRGGYAEISEAIEEDILAQLYKLSSINLCPNSDGQIMVDLMVNPPKEGDPSYERYFKEKNDVIQSLKRRAINLSNAFNQLKGVSCTLPNGAMYCFPKIQLNEKILGLAKSKGYEKNPDMYYALKMLNETGIVVVPGSGFGQKEGTFHFRTTFLPSEEKIEKVIKRFSEFHESFLNNPEKFE
jgi:alanine transaminase